MYKKHNKGKKKEMKFYNFNLNQIEMKNYINQKKLKKVLVLLVVLQLKHVLKMIYKKHLINLIKLKVVKKNQQMKELILHQL